MYWFFDFLLLIHFVVSINSNSNPFDDTILYNIKWNGPNEDFTKSLENLNSENAVIGVTDKQEKYLCMLPDLTESVEDSDTPYTGLDPLELLSPLFTQSTCSYRLESYWSYEICHGKFVKQYHDNRETQKSSKKQEFYLGRWDITMQNDLHKKIKNIGDSEQKIKTKKIEGVDVPYLQLNYTDGTLCDLNEKPRQTNVLYMCFDHGRHDIYSIKEIYTCLYEAIIFTPLLCKHPLYRPKNSGEKTINCSPFTGVAKKPANLLAMEADNFRLRHEQFLDKEQALKKVLAVFSVDKGGQIGEPRVQVRIHPLDALGDLAGPPLEPIKPGTVDYALDITNLLSGENCLQGKQGWWKFEFCYGKHIVQYHEEPDASKITINLGKFSLEDHKQWLKNDASKKPKSSSSTISHFYSKGSFCDEINAVRETEVKFKCIQPGHVSPSSIILYLEEPRVCKYVLHIDSPIVCKLLPTINEYGLFDESKIEEPTEHDEL